MLQKFFRAALTLAILVYLGGPMSAVLAQEESPDAPTAFSVNSNLDLSDANSGNGVCAASNGQCTLRAAVEEANALAGANEINIPAMTIVLTMNQPLRILNGPADDSLRISGAGRDQTIIDGNNATQVFNFAVYTGVHSISNLTIRNANNQSSDSKARHGGGIFNEATLTLTNVTVTNCRAFDGGGVYNEYAFGSNVPTLNLNSVALTNNTATTTTVGFGGGGLFNGSRLNGNDVIISGNRANLQGGGLYNNSYQSEIILRNFTISNNWAVFGGGINSDETSLVNNYALVLENGSIFGNSANCCAPSSNSAVGGAGIYNNAAIMRLTNVAIYNNVVPDTVKAGGYGGGIVNIQYIDLTNVSITGNQATYGAGIFNGNYNSLPNQMNLVNVTLSNNIGPQSTSPGSEGAAVFNVSRGRLSIINTTITQNQAVLTGGVANKSSTALELKNTILGGNIDNYSAGDCNGPLASLGYNIVGDATGSRTYPCTFSSQATDRLNTVPLMGPLTGLPSYHPLLLGSLAINTGTLNQCPANDIAGHTRPYGPTCDIGSYEYIGDIDYIKVFLPLAIR